MKPEKESIEQPETLQPVKMVEVTLKNKHTHAGVTYQADEKISVPEDVKNIMQQLGAI